MKNIFKQKSHDLTTKLLILIITFFSATTLGAQNQPFCTTIGGAGAIGQIPPGFAPSNPPSGPFYIRIYVHALRRSDGSGGQTMEEVKDAIQLMREDFAPHNIYFVWDCEVNYINNDALYNFGPGQACDLSDYPEHPDGIDIYLGGEDIGGSAGAPDIPSKKFIIGGTNTYINPNFGWNTSFPLVKSHAISHEMGHCLGLWHTFHGTADPLIGCNNVPSDPTQCPECVNGSNSQSCGDYVTDTPADNGMHGNWINPNNCNWYFAGGYQDPCNNSGYNPDVNLIMSYTLPSCMTYHSPGQGERMRQVIAISPVLQACLVQPDMVDVTISTNTTWTTANTPNNGDFLIEGNLTIMGGATLTINSDVRVRFGENSKVVIRPNARVRLSGTLTSMGCSQTWKGVEVQGSAAISPQSQYVVNGVRAQGRLEGLTGSVIENAETAVQLYGPTAAFAGGQISCNGTTFRNNVLGIDFANYLNFWPFSFPAGQQGQPRNYLGSFSRCAFVTDNDYPHSTPFNSFIYMSGVNGVNIAGTTFTNERDIEGSSIDDWGYGIQSVDAGFTVTSSANGIVYPPSSYTFSGFSGLGYAIQAQTSTVNRPYIVRQTNFDRNFVGIRNWSVDGATILFNNFNLGDLPSTQPTSDAVGVIFETDVSGFTCEENEFAKVAGPDGVEAIGTISINTGDQHKQIRRNTYTGLNIGNLANQQNAFINPPNSQDPIFRGLYYDCNRNFNVVSQTGIDFSVPDGIIRPRQGLETSLPGGEIGYNAAGNRFSYTGIDFSNFSAAINYYFDPLSANHEPLITQGGLNAVTEISADDNTCTQSFCEPPCRTDTELESIKLDYYVKKASLTALNATIGTNPTEQQKAARAYYQYNMDQAAYIVALHMMYDTIHYNLDSLRAWVANMNSIEGDLWLATDYLASGASQQTNAVLDAMPVKHRLTTEKQADIFAVKTIANAIAGQDPNNLGEAALQTLQPVAFGGHGWARGWARRLLTQHGWHFAPEYVKYGEGGGERQGMAEQTALASTLQVQPNPASDHVVFIMPANTAASDILRIFDASGRVVAVFTNLQAGDNLTWQTGNTTTGIYYYHFISDGKPLGGKILLNK
ncbi:MAG: T9SS type A sorting domain-containing protein [Lewinellaceae bacterium]|jgi:hypothetical protein|nr:T9SS type A sorting domain-containing protein [Lewinellaceae bacterium]